MKTVTVSLAVLIPLEVIHYFSPLGSLVAAGVLLVACVMRLYIVGKAG